MSDLVLKLALQVMVDQSVSVNEDAPTSYVVLLDALEEMGWWPVDQLPLVVLEMLGSKPRWESAKVSFVRAIAAYLLFEGWPTSWPLADRCVHRQTPGERLAQVQRLWEMGYITREQVGTLLDMPADEFWSEPARTREVRLAIERMVEPVMQRTKPRRAARRRS